jgi:hypothetical protein
VTVPTGITSDLYEGKDVTFAEFAMGAARSFGMLITMRDEPMGAPIPEVFEPDESFARRLADAQAEQKRLEALSAEEWAARQLEERSRHEAQVAEAHRKAQVLKARYEAMLDEVNGWDPPTAAHVEMKKFMRGQLINSIQFDCSARSTAADQMAHGGALPVDAYRDWTLFTAHEAVESARASYVTAVATAKTRTEWVRALRESLTGAPSTTKES